MNLIKRKHQWRLFLAFFNGILSICHSPLINGIWKSWAYTLFYILKYVNILRHMHFFFFNICYIYIYFFLRGMGVGVGSYLIFCTNYCNITVLIWGGREKGSMYMLQEKFEIRYMFIVYFSILKCILAYGPRLGSSNPGVIEIQSRGSGIFFQPFSTNLRLQLLYG